MPTGTERFRPTGAHELVPLNNAAPITNLPTGGVPSSKLEITVNILSGEANGLSLREFGLFGGTATIAFDSGEMVNWIVHSRIDKDSSLEISRVIRIEFVTL